MSHDARALIGRKVLIGSTMTIQILRYDGRKRHYVLRNLFTRREETINARELMEVLADPVLSRTIRLIEEGKES